MNRQVQAKCTGQYTLDKSTTTITSGRLAASAGSPAGWWIRADVSGGAGYGTYMTVRPVGDAIQMVFLYNDSFTPTRAQGASINALSRKLGSAPRSCTGTAAHAGPTAHDGAARHDHSRRCAGLAALHAAGQGWLVHLPVL